MPRRGAQSGRIHLHQRDTDDVSQLIDADMAINAEHAAAINETNREITEILKYILWAP